MFQHPNLWLGAPAQPADVSAMTRPEMVAVFIGRIYAWNLTRAKRSLHFKCGPDSVVPTGFPSRHQPVLQMFWEARTCSTGRRKQCGKTHMYHPQPWGSKMFKDAKRGLDWDWSSPLIVIMGMVNQTAHAVHASFWWQLSDLGGPLSCPSHASKFVAGSCSRREEHLKKLKDHRCSKDYESTFHVL